MSNATWPALTMPAFGRRRRDILRIAPILKRHYAMPTGPSAVRRKPLPSLKPEPAPAGVVESQPAAGRESVMIVSSGNGAAPTEGRIMRILLGGVSCVGKTTIGARLAGLLDYRFFDLDIEIERFFGTSIDRLRSRYLMVHDFRLAASQALKHVLSREQDHNCVIALPPSGLLGGYWKVVKHTRDATIVVLRDTPENILERITFYDIDSRPVQKSLTACEKHLYLREIKGDIAYFSRSFRRAHVSVDIAGCSPAEASSRVRDALIPRLLQNTAPERPSATMRAPG